MNPEEEKKEKDSKPAQPKSREEVIDETVAQRELSLDIFIGDLRSWIVTLINKKKKVYFS